MAENSYNSYKTYIKSKKSQIMWEKNRQEERCDHVEVSDGLKIEEMHKKIERLEKQVNSHIADNKILRADLVHARKMLNQTQELNKKLQVEVNKIHSRFNILDL